MSDFENLEEVSLSLNMGVLKKFLELQKEPDNKFHFAQEMKLEYFQTQFRNEETYNRFLGFLGRYIIELREYAAGKAAWWGYAIHTPYGTLAWVYPVISPMGALGGWNSDLENPRLALATPFHAEAHALGRLSPARIHDAFVQEAPHGPGLTGKIA